MQAKGWLQDRLCPRASQGHRPEKDEEQAGPEAPQHARILSRKERFRKRGSLARGYLLVEAMMTMSILTVLGLVLLKLSINVLHPRQWTLQQTITDAYMTYERSYAERVPFDTLVASGSPWPLYPSVTTSTVTLGKLPGGTALTGTVTRTRTADTANNYAADGGTGTATNNPAAMKIWKAQSVLTYKIGKRTYVKSRTVLRSQ